LAEGPLRQLELRRMAGSPAQTTMRSHLRTLERIGAIVKRRCDRFPGANEYELKQPGRELLFVIASVERWLADAPDGPPELGSEAARAAIKALAEGWSSTMLRALAARPMSLTELDRVIGELSYPSLERRLSAMRLAGQVEAAASGIGRGVPYAATDWLRRGLAPLAAATRWERRNLPAETASVDRIDVEAAFLLAVPLLRLPGTASGSCRLAVELSNRGRDDLAGVTVAVEDGRVVSCVTRPQSSAVGWAIGSTAAWLGVVIEADSDHLEIGGDHRLARMLLEGLYEALFGQADARVPDKEKLRAK
jgi:DNA-binding HxlR family transcriptional regulator